MDDEIPIIRPADARDIVRARLRDQPREVVEIAVLLSHELVANAIEHGAGSPRMSIEVDEAHVQVRVHDDDPTVDLAPVGIKPSATRGRGLAIVNALATAWGVDPRRDGKAVWFILSL